ncbi:UBC12 (YLR306W) [Zygosaccharomyces parabailii]|uniref:NEDD8-conjugating enzyme UBC12 n=1 Tax=Zygosaccharomyces bailii (strain CLIB 213 / ATCC 58445 / CBS 680 / BCRC 21525 / NBRC 1098 / NCYC 1416 / NRRL Y-2227) TaxID=1333698 RepID=A0A8J2T8B6_ZYGB2|nr:UBC12 (YLR306W) [Zygosaccharomyces parabailii]CDF90032.1 ZYBA0S05-07338g1_1 [Zygosaccharomyces bailii CLIB 213]SJM84491.1 probable NEDD8-conjugating enzyme UBC12 [Zygosaccharomyces bailii]
MFKLRQLQKEKQARAQSGSLSQQISAARLRLQKDLQSLECPPTVLLNVIRGPKDVTKGPPLLRLVVSPDEGFYKGGHFQFELQFNDNYPMEPPRVLCLNKIFHPNIDLDGRICLNVLRQDWSPALDVQSIVIGILFLFLEVTGVDPLHKQAAEVLLQGRDRFAALVSRSMAGGTINNEKYDCVTR